MSKRNLLVLGVAILAMVLVPLALTAQEGTQVMTKVEVRTGRVMKAAQGVIIMKIFDGPNAGYNKFTFGDVPDNVTLYRGDEVVGLEDLRTGDVVKGVIETTVVETISVTREEVIAEVGEETHDMYDDHPEEEMAEEMPAEMPKTGSPLGLLLLAGLGSLGAAGGVRAARRR